MSEPSDRAPLPPVELPKASRTGLVLFAVYCLLYAGFIALVVLAPGRLKATVLGGTNLAIVYGVGLIGGALVLALIYLRARRGGRGGA